MATKHVTLKDTRRYLDDFDWSAIDAMTDEDIAKQVQGNPDAAPLVAEPKDIDVKYTRERLHVSQNVFAAMFQINLRTLQNWEQRRTKPKGPARALLTAISNDPKSVWRALKGKQKSA